MASIPGAHGVTYTTTNAQTQATVTAAFAAASTQYVPSGGSVTGQFVADNTSAATYTGSGTSVTGFLPDTNPANPSVGEARAVYQSGTASTSTIYASDLSNATIINNNATGSLFGNFGAGGGSGTGLGLENTFTTDPNSSAAINFGTLPTETVQANVFNSYGTDTVSITGPLPGQTQSNDINAYGPAKDLVNLGSNVSSYFINNATGVSTVNASTGDSVFVGGKGNTLVNAGSGNELLSVDTSSGNVSLVGSTGSSDSDNFAFTHSVTGEVDTGTAKEVVGNFTSNDAVTLSGYGPTPVTNAQVVNGSTVLTLSDNTTITFVGITNTQTVTNNIKSS